MRRRASLVGQTVKREPKWTNDITRRVAHAILKACQPRGRLKSDKRSEPVDWEQVCADSEPTDEPERAKNTPSPEEAACLHFPAGIVRRAYQDSTGSGQIFHRTIAQNWGISVFAVR